MRKTLSQVGREVQTMLTRATPRAINGKRLAPIGKQVDGFHGHTDSDVEIAQGWANVGIPLDQEKDRQQQGSQQQGSQSNGKADWNHNQPKGKSAEMVMMRLQGSFSFPVGMPLADRRVQPMLKPGESAQYAMSGTGQMLLHNDAGSYLVVTNKPPKQSEDNQEKERYASMRHVDVDDEKRDLKDDEDAPDHKYEGKTINTEVRCTKNRIEFRVGDKVVGYYDKGDDAWYFTSKTHERHATEEVKDTAPKVSHN